MGADRGRYHLPLPVLQHYLGPAVPATDGTADGDPLSRRGWNCGCSATFRRTPHQMAAWQPCAAHRHSFAPQSAPQPEAVQQARGLRFCIVDSALNVLYQAADSEPAGLIALARGHVSTTNPAVAEVIVDIDERSKLRIVPVSGARTAAYALFVESIAERDAVADAVRKFRLTRREADVLRLLAAHHSNVSIGRELCIAESTAADHVKSLFRKLNCSKRTELFEIVFHS